MGVVMVEAAIVEAVMMVKVVWDPHFCAQQQGTAVVTSVIP